MLKRQIIFLGVWIALWSSFAADQLLITYEHLQPNSISDGKAGEDVVHAVSGRHCESGDLLVKDAMLPSDTVSGDILMSTSTGAYTFAMASNYNRVPKSGVVAVTNSGVVELVNRQSFQDTFINDI